MSKRKQPADISRELFIQKGKEGGAKTLKIHGTAHFKTISKLGIEARKKRKEQ